jgi:hypothetical protein
MFKNNFLNLFLLIGEILFQMQAQMLELLLGTSSILGLNLIVVPLLSLFIGQSLGLGLVQMQIQAMQFIIIPLVLILGLVLLLMLPRIQPLSKLSLLIKWFYYFFPEDWRGETEAKLQRLEKNNKSKYFILLVSSQSLLEFLRATIQIKCENLWLPQNKEIEK